MENNVSLDGMKDGQGWLRWVVDSTFIVSCYVGHFEGTKALCKSALVDDFIEIAGDLKHLVSSMCASALAAP